MTANQSPAITIIKKTNNTDNDAAPGINIPVGEAVTWTYEVKNTGNVSLTNVIVTDNKGVAVSCPQTDLGVDESMTCKGLGIALMGQYTNLGSVTGTPPMGNPVTATNPDHYFGSSPAITIIKTTNGTDYDAARASTSPVGAGGDVDL